MRHSITYQYTSLNLTPEDLGLGRDIYKYNRNLYIMKVDSGEIKEEFYLKKISLN